MHMNFDPLSLRFLAKISYTTKYKESQSDKINN